MPMFLEILFPIASIYCFQVRHSTNNTPKNLMQYSRFISELFIFNVGNFNGM